MVIYTKGLINAQLIAISPWIRVFRDPPCEETWAWPSPSTRAVLASHLPLPGGS